MEYPIDFDSEIFVCRDCKHLWKLDEDDFDLCDLKCPLCNSNKIARQPDYSKMETDEDGVIIRHGDENNRFIDLIDDYEDW